MAQNIDRYLSQHLLQPISPEQSREIRKAVKILMLSGVVNFLPLFNACAKLVGEKRARFEIIEGLSEAMRELPGSLPFSVRDVRDTDFGIALTLDFHRDPLMNILQQFREATQEYALDDAELAQATGEEYGPPLLPIDLAFRLDMLEAALRVPRPSRERPSLPITAGIGPQNLPGVAIPSRKVFSKVFSPAPKNKIRCIDCRKLFRKRGSGFKKGCFIVCPQCWAKALRQEHGALIEDRAKRGWQNKDTCYVPMRFYVAYQQQNRRFVPGFVPDVEAHFYDQQRWVEEVKERLNDEA